MTVRSYLIERGLLEPHSMPSARGEYRIVCPECKNPKAKCYVNGEGKGFSCKHCPYRGSWRSFVRRFEPPTPQEQSMEKFVAQAAEHLITRPDVIDYLHGRGINIDLAKALRLGYVDANLPLTATDVDREMHLANNGSWFGQGCIIIPYISDGLVDDVRARRFEGDGPKYESRAGFKTMPYVPQKLDSTKALFICEGEFDSMLLSSLGYQSMGLPGAQNQGSIPKDQIKTFQRIFLCMDADDAGRKATDTLKKDLGEVQVVMFPDGNDATDYISAFGIDSFDQLVTNAPHFVDGKLQEEDHMGKAIDKWQDWAWTNGELLGAKMTWAPRLERALSGWSRGLFLVGALPNSGKSCTAKGTLIRMYDGSTKRCEDVVVGDLVMGPDSTPREVLDVCSGTSRLHKVQERDGSFYEVTGSHLLAVLSKDINKGEPFTISPESLYDKPNGFHSRLMGYRAKIDYPRQLVWLDPYMLGAWLGDGTQRDGDITTADPEIKDAIYGCAEKLELSVGVKVKPRNKAATYAFTHRKGLPNQWRKLLDFYGLRETKRIPHEYLVNDEQTRLQVLAGLIDTDGSVSTSGSYDIVQKSQRLALDIQSLARSLGFYCSVAPCRKICTNNGVVGLYFRIYISGPVTKIPIRVERKKAKADQSRNPLTNRITVSPSGISEYYGFTVDKDNLFVLGDYTVTHNCFFVKSAYECAKDNPDSVVAYISLDDDQEDAITRLVSLHSGLSFELIRTPRFSFDHPTDPNRKKPEMLTKFFDCLDSLKKMENLIFRDARYGRSLGYLKNYMVSMRRRFPDKRIIMFIDSLAGISSEGDKDQNGNVASNWKAYLSKELKYLSTLHDICIVTPADFRKINDERRPTNDDLKDAAELAYEANGVLLGFNEMHVKGVDRATLKWQMEGDPTFYPIFELNISKNKKSLYKGVIRFKFYPPTSNYMELTEDEDNEFTHLINQVGQDNKQNKGTVKSNGALYVAEYGPPSTGEARPGAQPLPYFG